MPRAKWWTSIEKWLITDSELKGAMVMVWRGRKRIGVLGPHNVDSEEYGLGIEVGSLIAEAGALLLCGGRDGMMAAVSEGAKSAGGTTIGVLPGNDANEANEFIDIPLPTGLGPYRNALLVRMCDAVIAVHGAYGTLSEIAFALRMDVPVVGLDTWSLRQREGEDECIQRVHTPREAVQLALSLDVT